MRVLVVLVALALLACAEADGKRPGAMNWARTLVGARLKSQQMRLNSLGERLEKLVDAVKGDDEGIKEKMEDLGLRVGMLEDTDCAKGYMSCGRNSGQCVSELLVCDGSEDCENGFDECPDCTCINPVPPGKTWSGHVRWAACVDRGDDMITIVVTNNEKDELLPSRLHITAVVSLTSGNGDHQTTQSFTTAGTYSYGLRRVVLQPTEDAAVRIGIVCEDAGINIARCRFLNEADLHECGHATLGTKVHPMAG